jgi:hypothetical protein
MAGSLGIFCVWVTWGGIAALAGVAIIAINVLLYLVYPWFKRFGLVVMKPPEVVMIDRKCEKCGLCSNNTWEIVRETEDGEEIIVLCARCYRAYYQMTVIDGVKEV